MKFKIQAMKFSQLVEYSMRNIFLEKKPWNGETIPDPFLKNQNWAYLWSISVLVKIFVQFVFIVCQVEDYWNILKLSCRPLAFTS